MNKFLIFLILLINLNLILSFHNGKELTLKESIQQASFRFLISAAYRNAQLSREWCEDSKVQGGRPYVWSDHRTMAINYIDLYQALQFDPDCDSQLSELRKVYQDNVAQPTPYNQNKTFWDTTLLQSMLNAFSCGFSGSKIEDHEFVSDDLLENFNNDTLKQKVWFMVEDYMISIYKQRENINRRLDFDAGLYVPFLDQYTNRNYTYDQNMRVGFPTYIGRSLWQVFHMVAQRFSDGTCQQEVYDKLYEKFKNFFVSFAKSNHPCPFCQAHLLDHVLINDRNAEDPLSSEAVRFYPIEHLLLGGTGGDAVSKLSAIDTNDKSSLAKFFWILHNAVTSSVEGSCSCYMEETYDKDPYSCVFNSESIEQKRYPRQFRSYPFMKRFEFILTPSHNYTLWNNSRLDFYDLNQKINSLDSLKLRSELFLFWKNGTTISQESQNTINQLLPLIANMTDQLLQTPILSIYSYNTTLDCDKSLSFINSLNNTNLQSPSLIFEKSPEICTKYLVPSACVKQYKLNTTTIIKETESSFSIKLSFNFNLLILILLSLILLLI